MTCEGRKRTGSGEWRRVPYDGQHVGLRSIDAHSQIERTNGQAECQTKQVRRFGSGSGRMICEHGHFAAGQAQTGSESNVHGKELYKNTRRDLSFVAPMVGLGFKSNVKIAL